MIYVLKGFNVFTLTFFLQSFDILLTNIGVHIIFCRWWFWWNSGYLVLNTKRSSRLNTKPFFMKLCILLQQQRFSQSYRQTHFRFLWITNCLITKSFFTKLTSSTCAVKQFSPFISTGCQSNCPKNSTTKLQKKKIIFFKRNQIKYFYHHNILPNLSLNELNK